jgi:DNA-directed RNA polymerase subunit RPC12/RpoP
MVKKAILSNQLNPKCGNCSNRYNLGQAISEADRNKRKELRCPKCGHSVGRT